MAGALALFAGLIWAPVKPSMRRLKAADAAAKAARSATVAELPFKMPDAVRSGVPGPLRTVLGETKQLLTNRIWLLILAAAAIAAALTPFRTIGGPAVLLALIFPLTEASARWQGRSLDSFVNTLGVDKLARAVARMLAYIVVSAIVVAPAVIRMVLDGDLTVLAHAAIIAIVPPVIAVISGLVTRSAVTGRLILLIGWYTYLSAA